MSVFATKYGTDTLTQVYDKVEPQGRRKCSKKFDDFATFLKEFLHEAFAIVDLNSDDYVKFDPQYARPSDTSVLIGDTSKAKQAFGFKPLVTFKELVKRMVQNDIAELKQGANI